MRQRTSEIVHKALAVVRPQFRLDFSDGIHGLPHWSRVWRHGRELAETLDVDAAIVAWFAFLHDSQRVNDGRDPQHGARAADFALGLRRQGILSELDGSGFELLCEAMRGHSDGHVMAERAVQVCWDADRLDLARVGTTPHPDRLCTDHARKPEVIAAAVRGATRLHRRTGPPEP